MSSGPSGPAWGEIPCGEVSPAELLEMIRADGAVLAEAARSDPDAPVSRYPGWTMTDLLVHTGSVHGRTTVVLRDRRQDRTDRRYPNVSLEGSALVDWFEEGLRRLVDAFESTALSTPVWSLSDNRTAGFWLVRMALETAIHRWDARSANGDPEEIDARLAVCGIDEFARLQIPRLADHPFEEPGALLLECEDRPARWLMTVGSRGARLDRIDQPAEADAALGGAASDLYLALTGRGELRDMLRSGNPAVLDSLATAIATIPDAQR